MRLTKQYAYGLYASLPDELKVPMYHELEQIINIFDNVPEYVNIIAYDVEEFRYLRKMLADEVHPLLVNLLEVLAEDGLLNRLDTIAEDYQMLLVEANLLYDVKVSSATTLSSAFKNHIEELIQQRWGQDYLLTYKVDKQLIGGVRLEVNDAVVDTTFRSRIDQILREV